MNRREALFRKIHPFVIGLYTVWTLWLAVYNIIQGLPYFYLLSFGGLLFLGVFPALYRLLRLKRMYQLEFAYYLFVMLAFTYGILMRGYYVFLGYDKIMHTLSGTFVTLFAMVFFYLLKPSHQIERNDFALNAVFSIAVSLAVAGIWEIGEYFLSLIFHTDPQNVIGTGVADTMIDMIVCTLGSLILLFPMYLYYRRGKTSFFMGIVETFVRMNFSPEASVDAPCGIEAPSSVGADSAKAAGFAPRESGESSPQQ